MLVRPVDKYRIPRYPEKIEILRNPSMLKTVPERWKGNAYVGVALMSILAFTLTGCGNKAASAGEKTSASTQSLETEKALVAPIFEHGNGRGSFGCVSVAPPSFLSEEEAFQAIREEGARYGIVFDRAGLELKNVGIPETLYYLKPEAADAGYNQNGGEINSVRKGDLTLDGYAAAEKIGFEFISEKDYGEWVKEQGSRSSVDDYDFLSTAKMLKTGLEGKNNGVNIGIFYNPMTPYEELKKLDIKDDFEKMELKTKEMATDELRSQVRDFLQWLKAQGVI